MTVERFPRAVGDSPRARMAEALRALPTNAVGAEHVGRLKNARAACAESDYAVGEIFLLALIERAGEPHGSERWRRLGGVIAAARRVLDHDLIEHWPEDDAR